MGIKSTWLRFISRRDDQVFFESSQSGVKPSHEVIIHVKISKSKNKNNNLR